MNSDNKQPDDGGEKLRKEAEEKAKQEDAVKWGQLAGEVLVLTPEDLQALFAHGHVTGGTSYSKLNRMIPKSLLGVEPPPLKIVPPEKGEESEGL